MLGTLARTVLVVAVWSLSAASQHGAAQQRALSERYDFAAPTARHELPGRLDEISGLATTPDGRLFAHDDERATVHEIDPVTGAVGKRFSLGEPPLRGDFEGIAVVRERFFLVTSVGLLYEFREAEDRAEAPYRMTDTQLGGGCEVEGLDYDPVDEALLFACKVANADDGAFVIHRRRLDPAEAPLAPIEVARFQLPAHGVGGGFQPSSIAVDPAGTLLLVSAAVEALVEIDRSGRVLSGVALSRRRHPQPEGLAFGADGTLFVADERNDGDARLTSYARVGPGGTR
jgi:uncharacterized protein YjiK